MASSIVSPLRLIIAECLPSINNVIFNDPATIVFLKDGTKTVVKYQKENGDTYSKREWNCNGNSKKRCLEIRKISTILSIGG